MAKKFLCGICKKSVGYTKCPIQCNECNNWYHGVCENLSNEYWAYLGETDLEWLCTLCYNKLFPFSKLSEDEFNLLYNDINVEETLIYQRCMDFENIGLDFLPFNYD